MGSLLISYVDTWYIFLHIVNIVTIFLDDRMLQNKAFINMLERIFIYKLLILLYRVRIKLNLKVV